MSYNKYTTGGRDCQAVYNEKWQKIDATAPTPLIKRVTYYKWQNRRIIAALKELGEFERAGIIYSCGTYIETRHTEQGHEKIINSNFCRQRLCQVCAWRRSAKFTAQMIPVLRYLTGKGFKFLFLTLTVKNPTAAEVTDSVSLLLKAWDKFLKRRPVRRAVKGYVRSIEVTYNKATDTFHPHIHALLAVPLEYRPSAEIYITQEQLSELWRQCLGVDYVPVVDVRAVRKERSKRNTTAGAAVETLKYAYKVNYKDINTTVVSVLLHSLHGRRLISFGGVVAEARLALAQVDIDENLNDEIIDENNEYENTLYLFHPSGWVIIDRKEIEQ